MGIQNKSISVGKCCCINDVKNEIEDFFITSEKEDNKDEYFYSDHLIINNKLDETNILANKNEKNKEESKIINNKIELNETKNISNEEDLKVDNDSTNNNNNSNKENDKNLINKIYQEQNEVNNYEKKEEYKNVEKNEYNEILSNKEEINTNTYFNLIKEKIDENKVLKDKAKSKDTNEIIEIKTKNENKDKNENNINIINETKLSSQNKKNNNIIFDSENINKYMNIKNKDINTPIGNNQFKKTILFERDELYVNLIYFDYNMTNKENYDYYNNFQVDVVGGFYAIDDLVVFKNYLEKLKKKNIFFKIISSGSAAKDIIPICKKYPFIKEVIIFCKNYKYNEHYLKDYPGYVKQVLISIKAVYEYIKTFGGDLKEEEEKDKNEDKYIFSYEEIQSNKQLKQSLVITANEYDKCGYLVHKVYSNFFGDINDKNEKLIFDNKNLNKIYECLDKIELDLKDKEKLSQIFNFLFNLKDNESFVEESIRAYTGESCFCYLFNRMMRNYEKGLISFAYYMGPLLYGLNKYAKYNPKFALLKNKKLYRIIECSNLDFYLYKLNVGHIICFPSFTSTSSKEIKFQPSNLSKNINTNSDIEEKIKIKMIFKYKYKKGNISPGIIIEKNKGKDGRYLTKYAENEILLFPFTFVRIKKIKSKKEKGNKIQVIELEIINRTSYIEYILKTDDKNRILFSKLD